MSKTTTPEFVDFPPALTPEQAVPGTVVTNWMDENGKLYKIIERRNTAQVNVVREDGKKFYSDISAFQLSDRAFPKLPDYLPKLGDLVHVRGVRGVKPTDVLFVGSVTKGKAKCWLLDNSVRSVSLPIGNLTPVTGDVTVTVQEG